MDICVFNKTKKNIVRILGVDEQKYLSNFTDDNREEMINKAHKKLKIKSRIKPTGLYAGNPYIMLGRKVDSKGKRVK